MARRSCIYTYVLAIVAVMAVITSNTVKCEGAGRHLLQTIPGLPTTIPKLPPFPSFPMNIPGIPKLAFPPLPSFPTSLPSFPSIPTFLAPPPSK